MKKKRLGSIVLMIAVAVAVIAGWILASGYFTVKNAGYTMETMEDVLEGKPISSPENISRQQPRVCRAYWRQQPEAAVLRRTEHTIRTASSVFRIMWKMELSMTTCRRAKRQWPVLPAGRPLPVEPERCHCLQ